MTGIVADSGPLIMFARRELLRILHQITAEVFVPTTVFAECTGEPTRPGAPELIDAAASGVIQVITDPTLSPGSRQITNLGAGETMALASAQQRGCPVLMDDALGRKTANRHQIPVIGSAGILLAAKERGHIPAIAPILTQWLDWGYFLSPTLLDSILSRAGETT